MREREIGDSEILHLKHTTCTCLIRVTNTRVTDKLLLGSLSGSSYLQAYLWGTRVYILYLLFFKSEFILRLSFHPIDFLN